MQSSNLYLISFVQGKISIAEYVGGGNFELFRFKGEEICTYTDDFWMRFKEKIEYDGEPLSFVVLSDSEDFQIDHGIRLASENSVLSVDDIEYYFFQNTPYVLTFPKVETSFWKDMSSEHERLSKEVQKEPAIQKHGTLAQYYRKKTKEYDNG